MDNVHPCNLRQASVSSSGKRILAGSGVQHMDDKVLSYGDVLVRRSDVELLKGPCWLNDQIISFYFEWLTCENGCGPDVLLLPGSMTFLLLHGSREDVAQQAIAMKLAEKRCILLAVNDNPYVDEVNGGSHWTLLSYTQSDHTYRHYDSAAGSSNESAARIIVAKLKPVLGNDCRFAAPRVPRQANGYDCGMHVLATATTLCEAMRDHGAIDKEATQVQIQQSSQPAAVAKLRGDILAMFE